jgi:NADH dehydrogenase
MILVIGATGSLGGGVTRLLLERRLPVRIYTRPEAEVRHLRQLGAEVISGRLEDAAALARAFAGVSGVITTVSASRRTAGHALDTGGRHTFAPLIAAAEAAAVPRFILISSTLADLASPLPTLRAKAEAEAVLTASRLSYTVIAPTAFFEAWPMTVVGGPALSGRPVHLLGDGRRRHAFIASYDAAQFAVACLEHPETHGTRLIIGGPEALSWRNVLSIYESALGRAIPVVWHPLEPAADLPGLPAPATAILSLMETQDDAPDTRLLAQQLDVRLTYLGPLVRQTVAVAARAN